MLDSYKKKIKKRKDTTNRKIENKETDYTLLYIKRKRETTKKLFLFPIVGMTGLEPATTWSQTRYTTNCATSRFAEVFPYFCVAKVILFFYSCKYFSKIILLFLVQQRFFSRFELHALLVLLYV